MVMASGQSARGWSGYWLLVPLILAAILVHNWVEQPETLVPEAPMAISESQADYLLEDFTTRHYDADGMLEYLLVGASLAHYPDDGRAEISRPEMTLTRELNHWSVTAESGRLTRQPDVITLLGDVHIERRAQTARENDSFAPPISIVGSNIVIMLDDDQLSTGDRVRIESPGLVVEADGLRSSIKEGKLELLSDVSARYEAARPAADTTIQR